MDDERPRDENLYDFVFDPSPEPDRNLFHYTPTFGLAGVLDSGTFRLSRLDRLNDPRENADWTFDMSRLREEPEWPEDLDSWQGIVNRELRDRAHLGAFTVESSEATDPDDGTFLRGFARARNWAQYGGNHTGACLVLDRTAFEKSAQETAADLGATLRTGAIRYRDSQATKLEDGRFIRLPWWEANAIVAAECIAERHWKELFFRKNRDWESEREYRVVIIGAPVSYVEVPIDTSLRAIAIGSAIPDAELHVLEDRLAKRGLDRVLVGRLVWTNGAPDVRSASGDLDWRYRNQRPHVWRT